MKSNGMFGAALAALVAVGSVWEVRAQTAAAPMPGAGDTAALAAEVAAEVAAVEAELEARRAELLRRRAALEAARTGGAAPAGEPAASCGC